MSGRPFTYFDVARIAGNMTSKQIGFDEPWLTRSAEFVKLEEAICYLLNEWLKNYTAFPSQVGVGLAVCIFNLIQFMTILVEYQENDWEGFGGGQFGGAGATEGYRDIHWPWEGNPFKPLR